MQNLGRRLAAHAPPGTVVFLHGELGAGKTTLVRGFLRALGHQGAVKSPTFTLVEPYQLNGRRVFHFDLHRLADPGELEFLGMRDYLDGEALCLVEWPERAAGLLGEPDLDVHIHYAGRAREVALEPHSPGGHAICAALAAAR
jgi:tRNA threonylcarbamoyladenosine biosynthesis protein TsaE